MYEIVVRLRREQCWRVCKHGSYNEQGTMVVNVNNGV